MSNIDLGDAPIGTPPTEAQQAQIRNSIKVLQSRKVVKAADETRTSTTFAADSDLVIALDANSIYRVELYYFHTITAGAISARADYTGTLSDTLANETCGVYHGTSSGRLTWTTVSPAVTTTWASATATTPAAWIFTFSVKTATSGNFRLMWSAGTGAGGSSGTAIIKAGSSLIVTKLL